MAERQVGPVAHVLIVLAVALYTSPLAVAQDSVVTTRAVGSSSDSVSIRSGESKLFGLKANIRTSEDPPLGLQGQLLSKSSVRPIRLASELNILPAAAESPQASAPQAGQSQIEREARRLRAGVRGGVALDPELILMGVQAQFGPFFDSNVFFRPSFEFGFGEVTAMFGFNGEFIYQLAGPSPQDRWSPYLGGGLGINLLHQNFEAEEGGKRIDFGDFHSDTALNILGGVQNRNGVFLELRTSVYSDPSPTLRLVVGYNF